MAPPESAAEVADWVAFAVLREHGHDPSAATRGHGYMNTVWLTDEVAVRVSRTTDTSELHREARLAPLLPPGVGYPEVLEVGREDRLEWVLTRRIPGQNLAQAWPGLTWDQRAVAMAEMWDRATLVHRVDADLVGGLVRQSVPFYPSEPHDALASLDRLGSSGVLSAVQMDALAGKLTDFWAALAGQPVVVCHGDLSPINALWDGAHVAALLDFEFAGMGTAYIDLAELVKLVYAPPEPGETHGWGRRRAEHFLVSTARALAGNGDPRLLVLGHSILLEAWLVGHGLGSGKDDRPLSEWQSYRLLTAMAGPSDGYLAPMTREL